MSRLKPIKTVLLRWVSALSPHCAEVTRRQSQALDRRLGLGERLGLALHLRLCKWCRDYGQQIRFLREAARAIPPSALEKTIPLPDAARTRIKKALREK